MLPTTKLGPFSLGINNRAAAHALPEGTVRDAVNVDLSNEGRFRRRAGRVRVTEGSQVSSLWSNVERAFFADGAVLYEFLPGGVKRPIYAGLAPGARVTYCEVPGRGIAFSDGVILKRILGDAVDCFAVAGPTQSPHLSVSANGSLAAGLYQVACAFQNDWGEESGVALFTQADVPANGAILIQLPRASEPEATRIAIYVSAQNSEDVYLHETVPVAQASSVISVVPVTGRAPAMKFTEPLPPGDALAFYNARVYSHANGVVRYSEAWSGQHSPIENYLLFPEPVSIMHATPNGIWFVADRTYFMNGDPRKEASLTVRSNNRATRGTLVTWPDDTAVAWFSDQGLVLASGEGALEFMQQRHIATTPAAEGAAFYREQNGLRQIVAALRNPAPSVAMASTWFSATLSSGEVRNDF